MFREGSDLVRQAANFAPGQLPRVQFAECADMECLLLRVEQTCSERRPMTAFAQSGHQEVEPSGCSARTRSGLTEEPLHPQFDDILWRIASTECGVIPSSLNPGISGDDTVSISISST